MKVIFLDWITLKHKYDYVLRHYDNNGFYFRVYKIGELYAASLSGELYYYIRDNEINYNMWEIYRHRALEEAIADVEKYVKHNLNGKILKELKVYI